MVTGTSPTNDEDGDYYDRVQESWPAERPSRKRQTRAQRRHRDRQVVVKAIRRADLDAGHMSRALLAARNELERLQAETDAQQIDQDPAS